MVTVPIVIWIMIGYFETMPMELGGSGADRRRRRWQVFRHDRPADRAGPGIAVAFILAVIFSWNNFVFGIVLAGRETRTLAGRGLQHDLVRPVELGPARGGRPRSSPSRCCCSPSFAQRQIVAGLTAGAVKGRVKSSRATRHRPAAFHVFRYFTAGAACISGWAARSARWAPSLQPRTGPPAITA